MAWATSGKPLPERRRLAEWASRGKSTRGARPLTALSAATYGRSQRRLTLARLARSSGSWRHPDQRVVG